MSLLAVLFLLMICVGYRGIFNKKFKPQFIFITSIIFIFWAQPKSSIRGLDYWIPFATIILGIIAWVVISSRESLMRPFNLRTLAFVAAFLVFLGMSRIFPGLDLSEYFTNPPFQILMLVLILSILAIIFISHLSGDINYWILTVPLIAIFIVQKNQTAAVEASKLLRNLSQQSMNLANASEIVWVGYSYFAFRIMHTVIDWRKNRQIETRLLDYLNYLLFFPSYLAGPISRFDYFMESYETERETTSALEDLNPGMNRLIIGIFQKFIVSDFLYTFALNQNLADQISSRGWMWFSVLIYSLRLFFDFSGYTHIAIGLARIIGVRLPENFDKPFFAPTLTIFWNRWHITLTQWFRSYYFNPISRKIKRTYKSLDQRIILLFMQLITMVLIGLWHGINLNFVYWGMWTGAGLFLQNQISTFFKKKSNNGGFLWQKNPLIKAVSTGLTFLYVSLGWVWFALPSVEQSLRVFKVLFNI